MSNCSMPEGNTRPMGKNFGYSTARPLLSHLVYSRFLLWKSGSRISELSRNESGCCHSSWPRTSSAASTRADTLLMNCTLILPHLRSLYAYTLPISISMHVCPAVHPTSAHETWHCKLLLRYLVSKTVICLPFHPHLDVEELVISVTFCTLLAHNSRHLFWSLCRTMAKLMQCHLFDLGCCQVCLCIICLGNQVLHTVASLMDKKVNS